jgi:hypothetical protein
VQILGNYQSTLSSSYYQQLVTLLQQAIQAGDFGGGQTFDQAALVALQQEAQNFSTLPQPSAGQVVTDESFNHPLTLLAAQFAALLNESNAFATQLTALLAVLSKDTALVDQLLAEANLQTWASTIPAVTGANQIMWDFGVGYGPIAPLSLTGIWTDPATSATYPNNPTLSSNLATVLLPGLASTASGLTPPQSIATVSVNNLTWTYTTDNAQVEVLNQDNWTKLTLLEPQPLINFSSTPSVTPAASPFVVTGASNLGSLPVYIQTSFVGRQRHTTAAATNGTTISLSPYTVDTDEVYVFVGYGTTKQQLLSSATDYTVDQFGNFTAITLSAAGTMVDIFFEEEFPAYQCSVDQINWSPLLMLDTARPYPDNATSFPPIAWSTNSQGKPALPITDELGTPTGMYIEIGSAAPTQTYLLEASSQASPNTVGATAMLEIDFAQLSYLTVLRVTPFTTFPMILTKVEIQGITTNTRQTVWSGSTPIDQPTALHLDQVMGSNPLVSKVFLTFYQPNYSLKQQTVIPPDALRLNVMSQLQAVLPFNARNVVPPPAAVYTGAQYEFGVADVSGEAWTAVSGVFVSGPNRFVGIPELIRFDAVSTDGISNALITSGYVPPNLINKIPSAQNSSGLVSLARMGESLAMSEDTSGGPVDFYLCFQAFDNTGTVIKQNLTGYLLPTGGSEGCTFSFTYPFINGWSVGPGALSQIDHVDFYIKIVHRSSSAVAQRYMLQVTGQ